MTAVAVASRPAAALRSAVVCMAVGAAVTMRWQIFRTGALDGVSEGLAFGLALLAIASLGGVRLSIPRPGAIAAGVAAGALLVACSILARWPIPPLVAGHAAAFAPWVVVTTLVAIAEELVLRGVLWAWIAGAGGDFAALLATSLLFALIHVPIYGPAVFGLDLGVGLLFGGLRLWFGGPAASAAAHVFADLATWWL
jgi:membrane protease YdiL (CAAX protease family)